MQNLFKPATKKAAKLRLALSGPSGSGKTWTALRLAGLMLGGEPYGDHGFGVKLARRENGLARIAFIDTERGSASKYSDDFVDGNGQAMFDVIELERNEQGAVSPEEITRYIKMAGEAGYECVVVDSLSHAWEGILDVKDRKDRASGAKGANTFTNWRDVTPLHNKLIDAILDSPAHVIGCMRVKMEHVIERNAETGKNEVRKVGLKAIQRDGVDYEFDVVLDLTDAGSACVATVSKSRCSALKNMVAVENPGQDVASVLNEWLTGVVEEPAMTRERFVAECAMLGLDTEQKIAEALKANEINVGGARKYNLMIEALRSVYTAEDAA